MRLQRLMLLFVCTLTICSCAKNPFSTRDNEEPTEPVGTFIPPTSPLIVLENLRFAYAELVIGNFVQCLDSIFTYRFDFLQTLPGDTAWDYRQEVNLTTKMFSAFSADKSRRITIEFTPQVDQPDQVLDTTATLIRSYILSVTDTLGTVKQNFQGIARFDLVEGAFNFWSLRRWEDLHEDLDINSWAEFKNAYR